MFCSLHFVQELNTCDFFPPNAESNKEAVMRSFLLLTISLPFVNDILELVVNRSVYCLINQFAVSSKYLVELLASVAVSSVSLVQNVLLDCEC